MKNNSELLLMTSSAVADRIFQVDWWNDIKLET